MGCDGVWETFSNQEISNFIQQRLDKNMEGESILKEFLDENLAKDTISFN